MSPLDRRKERTRKWLQQALIALIQEQAYESITVQEITDRADTARITFYRHYRDKDELLLDCLETIYEELVSIVEPLKQADFLAIDTQPPILVLFQYMAANKRLYRILLTGAMAWKVQSRMQRYINGLISRHIETMMLPRPNAVPVDILATHMAASYLGLIVRWLEDDLAYPAEYLAKVAHWLNLSGLASVSGMMVDFQIPNLSFVKPSTE
jgi:AcrR family transcriptional regulator